MLHLISDLKILKKGVGVEFITDERPDQVWFRLMGHLGDPVLCYADPFLYQADGSLSDL